MELDLNQYHHFIEFISLNIVLDKTMLLWKM